MATSGNCKFCGGIENNDHIFRFCYRVSVVWNFNPNTLKISVNANVDFKTWLDNDVANISPGRSKLVACVNVISTMWSL